MKKIINFSLIFLVSFIFINLINLNYTYGNNDGKYKLILENNYDYNEENLVKDSKVFNDSNFVEYFFQKLSTPIVSSILLIISVVAFTIEIFLPTFGIAGIISIITLIFFFISNYLVGNVEILNLFLFFIGCILIFLEMIIPGFGLPGISGIIFVTLGIILSAENIYIGLISISISLIIGFIISFLFLKKGFTNKFFQKIILNNKINSYSHKNNTKLKGLTGIAFTDLRPSGIVKIHNEKINVITEGDYIKKGSNVKIIKVEGFKIIVRKED